MLILDDRKPNLWKRLISKLQRRDKVAELEKRIVELEKQILEQEDIGFFSFSILGLSIRKPITLCEKINAIVEYLDLDISKEAPPEKVVAKKRTKKAAK